MVWAITDDDEHGDHAVDVGGRRPVVDRLHELAEQERPDEPGQGRERVQAEHDRERRGGSGAASTAASRRTSGPPAIGSRSLMRRPPA